MILALLLFGTFVISELGDISSMKLYQTGGSIRDEFLGISSKDIDYACVCKSYEYLGEWLVSQGYEIVHEYKDKFTYRAKNPEDGQFYDYVFARTNEKYKDGNLISVEPGTLLQDLSRRDFTVNAIARDVDTGALIDPFNGVADCKNHVLRCVGDPQERFTEDPRRITRAIRFIVKCRLQPDEELQYALKNPDIVTLLDNPKYRDNVVIELNKAMKANPIHCIDLLAHFRGLSLILFSSSSSLDLHLELSAKQNKLKLHYLD